MVATNSMATRSSLELMLDKLQQTEDRPKDSPPVLPVRPVSRARLPRARRPPQLDFQRRNCGENGAGFNYESKRTQKEDFAESDGIAASAAQFDCFQKRIQLSENSKEIEEKRISKIQKCYRGHQVRCYYKELRTGITALQSFIRGHNARRGYQCKRRCLEATILIQKQTRNYLERRAIQEHESAVPQLQSGIQDCLDQSHSDETQVPHTVLVDLQKRVLRTEAQLREKNEQNIALKRELEEMEKKWQRYEERMKSMEKEWQDQFSYIQECLAAAKNNHSQIRDNFTITSVYEQELVQGEDGNVTGEVGYDQACLKFHPQAELRRLKRRFKTWKKEYKNKLRDAQSTFKKIGNSETAKSQKNWWGRLSH